MFGFSKVPRVFVLAGFILVFLVLGTSHYLYNDDTYYPTSEAITQPGSQEGDLRQATRPEDSAAVIEKPFADAGSGFGVPSIGEHDPSRVSAAPAVAPHAAVSAKPAATPTVLSPPVTGEPGDNLNPAHAPEPCSELEFVKRVHAQQELTDKVRYNRLCIQPVFSDDVDRNVVANVSTSIFGDEVTIDMTKCDEAKLARCTPVKLEVPRPYADYNVSHLIFGIATNYARLEESIDSFAHWLAQPSSDGAKLVALVTDYSSQEAGNIERLQQEFYSAGMNVDLVEPIDKSYTTSQSHFTVLAHMLNKSTIETQWYGLLDDDTFFPRGLKPLSDALAKLDPTRDYYVGALSEDFQAVRTFGFMAFGGAGAYLSAPLAKILGKELDTCIVEATGREGDIILRDCVYQNSKAKLTILPGLYQQDMKGDVSGFFESGVEAINLHHWKSWYRSPVVEMATAALYCGDCFLQRWRFGKDAVFTNGYSIARYLYDINDLDLDQMEGTWFNANRDYDFSIGPLRRKLVQDEKKSFQLKDVDFSERGEFKQLYVWKGNPDVNEADGVIEVVWQT